MIRFPESWVLLPVGEVVRNITLTDKKIPQKNYLSRGKFPVFDQGQDYVGGYTDEAAMVLDCDLPVIVFGDHTRAVKLVNTAFAPGADGIKVLQPSACILPKLLEHFACYLVTKIPNNGYARHYQHLAKSLLPIPPLAEQHRVVAKIEELFSELDQGVASLKTAREQLKVYRQSLLKNAFEGKLTAATGWREKSMGQLLGFLTSGSRGWAAYYATSGNLFVRAQNIKHDRLELDDVAFVALPDKAEGLRTRIQHGDLLITITGANVTKSALVKHDLGVAYVSQHVALCRPTTEILPEYLYWFVVAEAAGRKQLTDMAYGAGKPGLNLENIRSVHVPFPSLHEQQEIVELIESKLSEADQLDQTLATALQQADALRQSILKKAFHGQLVKQDKNEEPATALLERIRAEKSCQPKR
ncbi:MAG: restriction endonuclease subunit S [Rhodocyclaceae bacterium]|nr:restriction endonuclease subunit S [Rhodocyclaceae bacterium]